jgi:hypothetical protein
MFLSCKNSGHEKIVMKKFWSLKIFCCEKIVVTKKIAVIYHEKKIVMKIVKKIWARKIFVVKKFRSQKKIWSQNAYSSPGNTMNGHRSTSYSPPTPLEYTEMPPILQLPYYLPRNTLNGVIMSVPRNTQNGALP